MIVSVWSAYGHRFISAGEEESGDDCEPTGSYESCLTCGALYVLRPNADDPTSGSYQTNGGDEPAECTGDTGMIHGYAGERHCHEHTSAPDDECEHTSHSCPCVSCDS